MAANLRGAEPVTPAGLEPLLREALGDPTLSLALWQPERNAYADVAGRPFTLPTGSSRVAVTTIARNGDPFAVLVHDSALAPEASAAKALASTVLMLLENLLLVEELRRSRARVVAAAQQERLRLERNLHDGAQQRLFALLLKIRDLRAEVGDGEPTRKLDAIAEDASAALEELRELAHGLYPTVLRDRGLPDALRSLAARSAVPTEVIDGDIGRLPAVAEEAVYFCALEAIQNAVKHAGPRARVTVTFERAGDDLLFEIADDGVGFTPGQASGGIGLVGMTDRVGAVGGSLELTAVPGRGTTVRGSVPGVFAATSG